MSDFEARDSQECSPIRCIQHSVSNDANKDPEYDAHYLEQDVGTCMAWNLLSNELLNLMGSKQIWTSTLR